MRLRIVSDGTANGTKVTSAKTGEEIGGMVTAVSWSLDANSKDRAASVTLRLFGPCVDLDAIGESEEP